MQHKRFTVSVEESARSPFWQARMYLEGEGGKPRRWSTGVAVGNDRRVSKREAERAAQERAQQVADEVKPVAVDDEQSLDAVADRMLEFKAARRRDRAVDAIAFNLDKHVKLHFGNGRIVSTIKRADLECFKTHMVTAGYKPTSVNNALTAIRQVLKYACNIEETIESVPHVENVPVPKRSKVGKPISRAQAQRYIDSFEDDEAREFNLFLLNTGLRRFEALAVRWDWIDWDARVIRIPGEVRKGGKEQRTPTPMNDTVYQLLEQRLDRPKQPSKGRVWWQLKGGRKGSRSYDEERRKAAAKAGIAGYRHHDARHTRATWLGASGASAIDLRDAMNWETMAMVGLYTHPEQERVRELADRVEFSATGSATGQRGDRGEDRSTSAKSKNAPSDGKRAKIKAV